MNKAYASYFVSYLINELDELQNVNKIILFGSVARGEATKESDVDIFIDIKEKSKRIESKINKILNSFYKSREALIFKTKGIDNKINIIMGKINEWPKLRDSIESSGIVLYGNYISSNVRGKKQVIIFWDKIGKNRGAFLNKIYGFKANKKAYKGLIEILGGRKIGKSSIMIPVENKEEIFKLFKGYMVNAKILEVYA